MRRVKVGIPVTLPVTAFSIPGHDRIFTIDELKIAVQALVVPRPVARDRAPAIVKVRT